MGMLTSITMDEIRHRGSIRDGDVARLSAAYNEAAAITVSDAEALFALHAATPIQDPTWSPFFIAAITDYVVNQAPPEGYVVAENADWLREQISTFGRIETSTELTLLVHVLEAARWTPPSLAVFALDQIRHAVETGNGPLRAGRPITIGEITAEEVALAGRIIRAFGGDTSIAVTSAEADALIAINRSISPGRSSPAWSTLLVRTIGSAVLSALGHAVEPRRALIDAVASASGGDLADLFLGEGCGQPASTPTIPAGSGAMRVWRTARIQTSEERALARLERQRLEIVTNEVIEEACDAWLISRLAQSLPEDANEAAVLAYVMREAVRPTPELVQFAARRAIAA
jgi:hypothetical protein